MLNPQSNSLLIADPFLKDENFIRSVIYLCNHNNEGSFGLALNKIFEYTLNDLVEDLDLLKIPVFVGGPVATDTIHFLHQLPDLIPDSQQLDDSIFWGGDFKVLKKLLQNNLIDLTKIKFFIGYSGWSAGQLENEMEEKTWLTTEANSHLVFNVAPSNIWKESIFQLGGEYKQLIHYPIDPQLN